MNALPPVFGTRFDQGQSFLKRQLTAYLHTVSDKDQINRTLAPGVAQGNQRFWASLVTFMSIPLDCASAVRANNSAAGRQSRVDR
jgi:hypothetical protein